MRGWKLGARNTEEKSATQRLRDKGRRGSRESAGAGELTEDGARRAEDNAAVKHGG